MYLIMRIKVAFSILLSSFFCLGTLSLTAQVPTDKQLRKTDKELEKELSEQPVKRARKEAKDLEKQGYYNAPGSPPLDMQLEEALKRQIEKDDYGYPLFIISSAEVVAGTKTAARNQAVEVGKLELAGQIQSNVLALVETSLANQQITQTEAASLSKTVTAAKNVIAQKLGRILILFEAYKDMGSNVAVAVRLGYNNRLAMESAKDSIRKELEEKGDELHKRLNEIMKF